MKLNKFLVSAALLLGGVTVASAQEEVTESTFQPHWYLQAQIGGQETLGEGSFGDLLCPNAQIAVGYNFNPYIGARLVFNGWQSKGVSEVSDITYKWKWNYIAPTINAVFNMTNVLGGYNPNRMVEANIFGGIGANIAWHNKDANNIQSAYMASHDGRELLEYNWSGTHGRFVAQFGADVQFNVTKEVAVGLELQANVLPDQYNSKKAANADWYFNALVGVRYTFGPKFHSSTRIIEPVPCEPVIVEKIVEKIVEVEKPVEKVIEAPVKETLRRDIFFTISNTVVSNTEMKKVAEVAEYLNSHPGTKVEITGYADKGTGTMAINLRLSKQRANAVSNALQNKYKIPASRIIVKSMGEENYQPYSDPIQNRVAICIVEDNQ
ncbi:MAG: OmpA family protein [Muribaculaceae bacterium]|nr:OmpA family protein [Muribaculaceae bacterium]